VPSPHSYPTAEELVAEGVVSPKEAARLLGVGITTIYAMMADGTLPYCRVRADRRIPRIAITRYLAGALASGR
jgi:excisionase family DNA binding protein